MNLHRLARTLGWILLAPLLLVRCGDEAPGSVAPDGGADGAGGAGGSATAEPAIGERTFTAFAPWSTPIEDYLAVGERNKPGQFNAGIHDLVPFGERMWLGYGDADYNLGELIPIELRAFVSPDDPNAVSAEIDGAGQGAPQTTPYQSGEEQIDRYRLLDGVLWQAGIDSTDPDELYTQANTDPPGIQGNVYRLDGELWRKYRSITGGEHVHDLATWQGAVYGVGSGADTRKEFEAGQIFRYLWRSTDDGESFTTIERIQHPVPGKGDTRWVNLLATTDALYLFGFESDWTANTATIHNAKWDGQTVSELAAADALGKVYPDSTLTLPDGSGLWWGVDVGPATPHYTAARVTGDGALEPLDAFAGSRVIDVAYHAETEELVYLVFAGDAYVEPATPVDVRVVVADRSTPGTTIELSHFTSEVLPRHVAYWQGSLFLGMGDGTVLRATTVE